MNKVKDKSNGSEQGYDCRCGTRRPALGRTRRNPRLSTPAGTVWMDG